MNRNILHVFMWKIPDIISALPTIKSQGFTHVLLSTVQNLKCDYDGSPWYMTYQTYGLSSVGNRFGSEQDLIDLCQVAHELGIKILVDVVSVNMANEGGEDLEHVLHHKADRILAEHKEWFREPCRVQNWNDRYEITHRTIGMPSLDFYNEEVQEYVLSYLNKLIDLGVDGFRMDSMKSIPTVQEGCDFLKKLKHLQETRKVFIMGEVIFSPDWVVDMYSPYIHVLTESVTWDKDKMVTFPLSHDTEYEFSITNNMTDEMIINEYCVLNKIYKNTMLYLRPYCTYWKDERIKYANESK